jgi:hypothetical protein
MQIRAANRRFDDLYHRIVRLQQFGLGTILKGLEAGPAVNQRFHEVVLSCRAGTISGRAAASFDLPQLGLPDL